MIEFFSMDFKYVRKNLHKAVIGLIIVVVGILLVLPKSESKEEEVKDEDVKLSHWLVLYRKSNKEELYKGVPGNKERSELLKTFTVKTGIPGERPTPLPKLLEKEYFLIVEEREEKDNLETAPYFLKLNIPASTEEPYGPVPYKECNGSASAGPNGQCNWVLPGDFGLHGVAGNPEKLSENDPGSSGCIRHKDEDITYLYELLDPTKEEIRYYVEDI